MWWEQNPGSPQSEAGATWKHTLPKSNLDDTKERGAICTYTRFTELKFYAVQPRRKLFCFLFLCATRTDSGKRWKGFFFFFCNANATAPNPNITRPEFDFYWHNAKWAVLADSAGRSDRPNIEPRSRTWMEQTGFRATRKHLTQLPNTAKSKDFSPTGPFLFSFPQSPCRESQQPSFPPNVCAAKRPPAELVGKMSTPKSSSCVPWVFWLGWRVFGDKFHPSRFPPRWLTNDFCVSASCSGVSFFRHWWGKASRSSVILSGSLPLISPLCWKYFTSQSCRCWPVLSFM